VRSTHVKVTEPRSPQRLTAAARRAQLLEVGRSVFAKRGYEATSVEEIAERAKVSKPIVYEHFGGKEGLYAVVVDREMEHVVTSIAESISSGTPRERIERAALAFLTDVKEQPDGFAGFPDAPIRAQDVGLPTMSPSAPDAGRVQAGYDPVARSTRTRWPMVAFVGCGDRDGKFGREGAPHRRAWMGPPTAEEPALAAEAARLSDRSSPSANPDQEKAALRHSRN
jgi:AcrR family transcriptional regulator